MRLLKPFIILILTIFVAQDLYADRSKKRRKKKRSQERTSQIEERTVVSRYEDSTQNTTIENLQSSEGERADKIISLTGGLISASAGVYVHRNVILGVKYSYPVVTIGSDLFPDDGWIIQGYGDVFFGNSFYATGGFGQRTLTYDDLKLKKISIDLFTPKGTRAVSYTDLGINLGVGNRWQWKYFSIGAEWVGVYVKLSDPEARRSFKGNTAQIYDDILEEKKLRDELTNPTLTSSFYVGLSF
jgi:hypothetical protein